VGKTSRNFGYSAADLGFLRIYTSRIVSAISSSFPITMCRSQMHLSRLPSSARPECLPGLHEGVIEDGHSTPMAGNPPAFPNRPSRCYPPRGPWDVTLPYPETPVQHQPTPCYVLLWLLRNRHTLPESNRLGIDMLQPSQSADGTGGRTSRADKVWERLP
jgi:hypothetical protein